MFLDLAGKVEGSEGKHGQGPHGRLRIAQDIKEGRGRGPHRPRRANPAIEKPTSASPHSAGNRGGTNNGAPITRGQPQAHSLDSGKGVGGPSPGDSHLLGLLGPVKSAEEENLERDLLQVGEKTDSYQIGPCGPRWLPQNNFRTE